MSGRNKGKAGERERRRIIIDNQSSKNEITALNMVANVIRAGRVSNGGYCYGTHFKNLGCFVYARKNKASDSFLITEGQGE